MKSEKGMKGRALPLINDRIRANRVQLITSRGENIGVVSRSEALRSAREDNLDLVLIAESGEEGVPVVKVMDFGKSQYQKQKKQAESKKSQKIVQIKELKFRPSIGEHDYQTKMKRAISFLNAGKRVKFTLFFRGRENITKNERGKFMFDRINKSLESHGLLGNLVQEKDSKAGQFWSRIYYLKNIK